MIENFFQFNVLHGRHLCGLIIKDFLPRLKETTIELSDNLVVCTVSDNDVTSYSTLNLIQLKNKEQIKFLKVDQYIKWISKVETLYYFIKDNYNNLPNYILYLDGLDTLILKDILNPAEYLDFYNCKILFNVENQYAGTGYMAPNETYLHDFYNTDYDSFLNNNLNKYGNTLPFGLNAGVFLGEKEYVFKIVKECYEYMLGNIEDGFPHGCSDDQYVFRYLQNKYYDIISADVFNVFSFWGGLMSIDDDPNHHMFKIGYTQKYLQDYLNKKQKK